MTAEYVIKYKINAGELYLVESGQPLTFDSLAKAEECAQNFKKAFAAGEGGWPYTEFVEYHGFENFPEVLEVRVCLVEDAEPIIRMHDRINRQKKSRAKKI